jgi:hypothetical protein
VLCHHLVVMRLYAMPNPSGSHGIHHRGTCKVDNQPIIMTTRFPEMFLHMVAYTTCRGNELRDPSWYSACILFYSLHGEYFTET